MKTLADNVGILREAGFQPSRRGLIIGSSAVTMTLALRSRAFAEETIVIAINDASVGSTPPFYIAQAKGYYKQAGVDVSFVKFDDATHLATAVISGSADLGSTALSAGFWNVAPNGDLHVIGSGSWEKPGFHGQCFITTPANVSSGKITSAADFAGKKIGLSSFGGGYFYDLVAAAKKYNFAIDKSKVAQLNSSGNILSAVIAGAVDCGLMSGAPASAAVQKGQIKIVGYIGDIAPYMSTATFANTHAMQNKRDALVRVMRATVRAAREFSQNFLQRDGSGNFVYGPEAADLVDILAKSVGTSAQAVRESIQYIDPDLMVAETEIDTQVANWKGTGLVNADADPSRILDLSILKAALAS